MHFQEAINLKFVSIFCMINLLNLFECIHKACFLSRCWKEGNLLSLIGWALISIFIFHRIKELVRGEGPSDFNAYGDPINLDYTKLNDLHPRSWLVYTCFRIFK